LGQISVEIAQKDKGHGQIHQYQHQHPQSIVAHFEGEPKRINLVRVEDVMGLSRIEIHQVDNYRNQNCY
jgi:hypothetical protein